LMDESSVVQKDSL
jgi:hypothetical protein